MGLSETLLFYLLIGLAVGVAAWPTIAASGQGIRSFRGLAAVLFWPLYIPMLLAPQMTELEEGSTMQLAKRDELALRINEVERELDTALRGMSGWGQKTLSAERLRIEELRAAWTAQANRIREMDTVLATLSGSELSSEKSNSLEDSSDRTRLGHITRLKSIRDQAAHSLFTTLNRVRELVTLIHLARFTGEPATRADELLAEIAASVEGLAEVATWRSESTQFEVEVAGRQCGRTREDQNMPLVGRSGRD